MSNQNRLMLPCICVTVEIRECRVRPCTESPHTYSNVRHWLAKLSEYKVATGRITEIIYQFSNLNRHAIGADQKPTRKLSLELFKSLFVSPYDIYKDLSAWITNRRSTSTLLEDYSRTRKPIYFISSYLNDGSPSKQYSISLCYTRMLERK